MVWLQLQLLLEVAVMKTIAFEVIIIAKQLKNVRTKSI